MSLESVPVEECLVTDKALDMFPVSAVHNRLTVSEDIFGRMLMMILGVM